jgi:putative spermidine/putrescine transport system ATP-binding protein
MREELKRLQAKLGITFIHVTHSQEEALALSDLIVVMDGGKVQQTGPAREIFEAPQTGFVARFIGGHNVVGGKVVSASDGLAVLRSRAGEFRVPGDAAIGSDIAFAVRSDRVRLTPHGGGDGTSLQGRVANIEYHGNLLQVRLEAETIDDFIVTLADSEFHQRPLRVGDAVAACWTATDARLLSAA